MFDYLHIAIFSEISEISILNICSNGEKIVDVLVFNAPVTKLFWLDVQISKFVLVHDQAVMFQTSNTTPNRI